VRRSEADGNLWLTTLSYTYQWQATEDDGSWFVRWEYERESRGPYPRSHVHVNAAPAGYAATDKHFAKLHLPSGRVAIEHVVDFLVREHGVPTISKRWAEVLEEASRIFAQIQARGRPI
jgi:hypothetical protein